VLVADHLQDPQNLGAIIRSAEAAGAGTIIIPEDRATPVSPVVELASAGATAWLPVIRCVNLSRAVERLKRAGYWTVMLGTHGGQSLFDFVPPRKLALVIGGETGVSPLLRKSADFTVSIPMSGKSESLNASAAAAVALFEVRRRWQSDLDR
jgi:23S rRNA (guanosine2251-2'-O)-methyltransferase